MKSSFDPAKSNRELKKPEELLTLLNSNFAKKHNYKFSYNNDEQRFFLKKTKEISFSDFLVA